MDGDRDRLLRVVERLAIVMADSGVPRMAARVYAYILADDADRYTARELADGLGVSLAAISGALKYLVNVRMVEREREPGARADSYVIDDDDLWSAVMSGQASMLEAWTQVIAEGADTLGNTRGGLRLRESQLFFEFLGHDMESMVDRWHAYRAAHLQRSASSATGRSTQSAT